MQSVTIIGAGAIGCSIGAALLETKRFSMTLVSREKFETLKVLTEQRQIELPVSIALSENEIKPSDWVFLSVKAHQTPEAEKWLRASLGPRSKLAIFQNGVEHEDRVKPFIPANTEVLPVVIKMPAERVATGEVQIYGESSFTVPNTLAGKEFTELFQNSFIKAFTSDDFTTEKWKKLCFNVAIGPLSVLTGNKSALSFVPGLKEVAREIIEECRNVAEKEGAEIEQGYYKKILSLFVDNPSIHGNSMFYDWLAGKTLEYDALNGAVVRFGEKHGIATPINSALVSLLRALSPPYRQN